MTQRTTVMAGLAAVALAGNIRSADATEPKAETISEFPDRMSMERSSDYFYDACEFIGVRVNGEEQAQTVEFCVSGRWARIAILNPDKTLKRDVNRTIRTTKVEGVDIEVYWRLKPSRQVRRALARKMK